jgi:hypothetical protein
MVVAMAWVGGFPRVRPQQVESDLVPRLATVGMGSGRGIVKCCMRPEWVKEF